MGLKNCPECGRLFMDNPAGLCLDCVRQEEKDSDKVGEFLRDKKRATIEEIHEATEVKHKIILKMIKSGRLFGDVAVYYPCESCNEPISEGRVCTSCRNKILSQVKPVAKVDPKPTTGKIKDTVYLKYPWK